MKSTNLFLCILVAAVGFACAEGDGSSTKSLDNFAAGQRVQTNKCQGDPAMINNKAERNLLKQVLTERVAMDTSRDKDKLSKAVLMSFRAVPTDLQEMFMALGGTIMVSSKANQLCSSMQDIAAGRKALKEAELKALSEAQQQITACYYFMPPAVWQKIDATATAKRQLFTIILKDDPGEIHHNLVRTFGYIASQVSSHLTTNDPTFRRKDLKVRWTEQENADFRAYKKRIFQAFLADLAARDALGSFAKYRTNKVSSTQMRYMEDFAYAEAFDSFFCNQYASGEYNTLDTFKKSFKRTLQAYLNPPQGTSGAASLTGGFGLTGGAAAPEAGFGMWNPFTSAWNATVETYQGTKILYNEYAERRNQRIDRLTEQVMEANGGKPPTTLQTLSIAANGAYRDEAVTNNAIVGGVVKPAIEFADAAGGATIDTSGDSRILSQDERLQKFQNGAVQTALEVAPIGDAVGVVGRKSAGLLRSGGQQLADTTVEALARTGREVDLDTAARLMRASDATDNAIDATAARFNQFNQSVDTFKQQGLFQRESADFLQGQVDSYTPQGLVTGQVKDTIQNTLVDDGSGPAGTFTPMPVDSYSPPANTQPVQTAPLDQAPPATTSDFGVPGGQIGPPLQ